MPCIGTAAERPGPRRSAAYRTAVAALTWASSPGASAVVGSSPSVAHLPLQEAALYDRHQEDHDGQHHADCCRVAHAQELEGVLIQVQDQAQGGVKRTTG